MSAECPNCGAELDPSLSECDFCGLLLSEMAGGSAQVPLEHRLGHTVEPEKTFDDSLVEQQQAIALSVEAEHGRQAWSQLLRRLAIAATAFFCCFAFYQIVIKAGWANTATNGVIIAMMDHRPERAHAHVRLASKYQPLDPEPHFLDAGVYMIESLRPDLSERTPERNLEKAEYAIEKVLRLDPDHGPARYYLAVIHYQQGRPEVARSELEKALKDLADDPESKMKEEFGDAAAFLLGKLKYGEPGEKIPIYSGAPKGDGGRPPVKQGEIRVPFGRYTPH